MIKRSPLKTDSPGKCSRWHVVIYNRRTKKRDWHTVRGTKEDAKALERDYESAKRDCIHVDPLELKTFQEVANLFLDDRRANNRRIKTLKEYRTELKIRLLPQANGQPPPLGPHIVRNIWRADMKALFDALSNSGCTVSQINKSIKAAKAIFTYAYDKKYVTSNIMHRYPKVSTQAGEGYATGKGHSAIG